VQAGTLGLVERSPDCVKQGEGDVGVGRHGGLNRRVHCAPIPGLAGKLGDPANRVPVVTESIGQRRRAVNHWQVCQVLRPARQLAADLGELLAGAVDKVLESVVGPGALQRHNDTARRHCVGQFLDAAERHGGEGRKLFPRELPSSVFADRKT
jgi:hypothetical protein